MKKIYNAPDILFESFLLSTIAIFLSIFVAARIFRKNAIDRFAAAFSNAGFIGIPLIIAAMGQEAVFYICGLLVWVNLLQWSWGVATIKGEKSAQVMLVVGSDTYYSHPNWEQNLVVATAFRDSMDKHFPSLSRSLYLRTARFNQEYRTGCMLLEVGSAANSLEEAENAAAFAAEAFVQMLKEKV